METQAQIDALDGTTHREPVMILGGDIYTPWTFAEQDELVRASYKRTPKWWAPAWKPTHNLVFEYEVRGGTAYRVNARYEPIAGGTK